MSKNITTKSKNTTKIRKNATKTTKKCGQCPKNAFNASILFQKSSECKKCFFNAGTIARCLHHSGGISPRSERRSQIRVFAQIQIVTSAVKSLIIKKCPRSRPWSNQSFGRQILRIKSSRIESGWEALSLISTS